MSRTLRRPMFRGGGKIESRGTGITSGLDDRPGYAEAGSVMDQTKTEAEKLIDLQKEMGIFSDPEKPATTFGLTRPELLKLAQRSFEFASKGGDETLGQKLAGSASDALGDISTSMLARKEKFKEQQREQDLVKAGLIEKAYGTVSDRDTLEKTLAAEKELEKLKLSQGSTYEVGYKLGQLKVDFDKDIALAGGDQKKIDSITRKYNKDRNNLLTGTKDKKLVATALLNNPAFVDEVKRKSDNDITASETLRLQGEGKSEEEIAIYITSDEFLKLREQKFLEVLAGYATINVDELLATEENLKEGGRVGLAQGGMSGEPMANQSTAQNETGISFEEVRSRLPQEISDDIVRLIVSSPMAFEDFAGIQTQIDVENFNSKYNVNLSLPQEA